MTEEISRRRVLQGLSIGVRPDPTRPEGTDKQYNGKMDGFATASSAGAMGSFTRDDIPFYFALAAVLSVCDPDAQPPPPPLDADGKPASLSMLRVELA